MLEPYRHFNDSRYFSLVVFDLQAHGALDISPEYCYGSKTVPLGSISDCVSTHGL
jgi:hypothetical protein